MKSAFIIVLLLVASQSLYAQSAKSSLSKITGNSSYILTANQDGARWKDTTYYYAWKLHRCRYVALSVILTNIGADTLRYIDMSCSTLDIFTTDLKDARISQDLKDCYKNNPTIFTLAPYSSVVFVVPVYVFSDGLSPQQRLISKEFKIGMGLFKDTDRYSMVPDIRNKMSSESQNIIWSKAITVE